ncbi:sensor histidine kinase [Sphaerimonospora cavernae]|uniref:histidine kinase n=1 Tax=Sphaerimonospora cavernae TaxID=1740611 RepID=A0ABV6U3U9_9ACTN
MIILAVIGAGSDFVIRKTVESHVFNTTQQAAMDWMSSMRLDGTPRADGPADRARLLQLVDSRGRVVAASAAAADRPPLSTIRPPVHDRIQYLKTCSSQGGCVLLTAMRPTPQAASLLWSGEPHYVYSGAEEPGVLAGIRLEAATAALVLLTSAFSAWIIWLVVGRTLRPVAAIREKISEATVRDVSLRLPEPPGDDEIARLARASNRFLDQLDKLVSDQRRFASMVSHELRSPAAALRAQVEEALLYPDDVDPHEALRGALRSTERFQRIIDELLAYTRVKRTGTSAPEPVDLTAMVRAELGTRPPHGKPVLLHAASERLTVLGIRLHLLGVLSNLLANAQRHAHSRVDVTVERSGDQAVLIVQDDGDGIASEDRERVFEPFVRLTDGLRRDPGGSGLGLAICREAARAHHGSLAVEDSPQGARFVLRLPLTDLRPSPQPDEELQPARS